jgi:hypothetical protein
MDKLAIGPDVTSLPPEEFKKKDKAAQARAEAHWERAKAKGMSRKKYIEAMTRAEIKASRSMANVERDFNIEPKVKIVRDDDPFKPKAAYSPTIPPFIRDEGGRGGRGGGGGGMNPTDIEKVPGKRQFKFQSGGKVSASKRADGIAKRGKTRGKVC